MKKLRRYYGYPKYLFYSRRGRYERTRSRPYHSKKSRGDVCNNNINRVISLFDRFR